MSFLKKEIKLDIDDTGTDVDRPDLDKVINRVLTSKSTASKRTVIHEIVVSLCRSAIKGDTKAASLILERAYGKTVQNVVMNNVEIPELVLVREKYKIKDDNSPDATS